MAGTAREGKGSFSRDNPAQAGSGPGGTGAGDGIEVKCRDFPLGKASPSLSQASDNARGDLGKEKMKKGFCLCSE